MNKKTIIKIIIFLIILIVLSTILYTIIGSNNDNSRFKNEYENLNNTKSENGKKYLNVEIPKENLVKYATYQDIMNLLKDGTGIIYFGFPECPWCRNAVPTLIKTAKKEEVSQIYYYNAKDIRDEKELKNGKIITTKDGTKEYKNLLKKLNNYLPEYEGLNDKNIKRIYFPTVIFVMGGKVVGSHTGTVDSQKNPYIQLTTKQQKELEKIYTENINKMYGVCDESC
jgi:thiol-disulfide isomerase/thioredoxin